MNLITLKSLIEIVKQLPDPKTCKWSSVNIGEARFHKKDGLWQLSNSLVIDEAARTAK